MNILFGFAGRVSRLGYFVLTLLAVAMTLLIFSMIFGLAPHFVAAGSAPPPEVPMEVVLIAGAVAAPIFMWFTLALQAKRFRDIGWKPEYVLPGWIAVIVIDKVVAVLLPSIAMGHDGTVVGGIINLVMIGALLLWPGAPHNGDSPLPHDFSHPSPEPTVIKLAARLVASPNSSVTPSGIGRRGHMTRPSKGLVYNVEQAGRFSALRTNF